MTSRELDPGRERTPEEIQADIERTRAAMKQDIKAIGDKLSPEELKQSAANALSYAKEEGANMVREVKDAGVESLRAARDRTVEAASETAHEIAQRARDAGAVSADYARDAARYARRAGSAGADFVAANALPLSLIGVGVGWLVLSARRQHEARLGEFEEDLFLDDEELGFGRDYDGDEYVGALARPGRSGRALGRGRVQDVSEGTRELVDNARVRAGELADNARTRVGELADSARARAGELAERASRGVDSARTRVSEAASELGHQASELSHEARVRLQHAQARGRDFAEDNPLVVGALAVAAGLGIGLLLPATRPENRLLGGARDRLLGDARSLLDEARASGERLQETARETAQELRSGTRESRISH